MASIFDQLEGSGVEGKKKSIFDKIPVEQPTVFEAMRKQKTSFKDIYSGVAKEHAGPATAEINAMRRLLEQNMSQEEADKTARSIASSQLETAVQRVKEPIGQRDIGLDMKSNLQNVWASGDDDETKRSKSMEAIHQGMKDYAGQLHDAIQSKTDWQRWDDEAEKLKGKFHAKNWRRWERGSALMVGGGYHLLEELQLLANKAAAAGNFEGTGEAAPQKVRDATLLGEYARMYHQVLNTPEMQPVVENAWDKWGGGGIEMAPFIAASSAPGILTGGATLPSTIGGFLTAYAVEGNTAYQNSLDRGDSENVARARGIATGLINGGIEMAGGGGAKYLDKAVNRAVGKLGRLKTFGKNTIRVAVKEGLMEEVPQEMVQMAVGGDVPRFKNGDIDWNSTVDRLMDTAAAGMIAGGLLESPFSATHALRLPRDPALAGPKGTTDVVEKKPPEIGPEGEGFTPVDSATRQRDLLQDVPLTDPPETVSERQAAERLANEWGITGQEALEHIRKARESDTADPDVPAGESKEPTETETLTSFLRAKQRTGPQGSPTERMNRSGVAKLLDDVKRLAAGAYYRFSRVERLFESLDGHEPNGPIRRAIWGRLRPAVLQRKQAIAEAADRFKSKVTELGADIENWMTHTEVLAPGVKLTKAQQIGVAMLSQNEHGIRYLREGMRIGDDVIKLVMDRLTPEQTRVMEWMQAEYQRQWEELHDAAIAAGIDPKLLQQEKAYFPLMRLDKDAVSSPQDLMSLLTDRMGGKASPASGMLKKRIPGAEGEIELDALTTFLNSLAQAESFKALAPTAMEVAKITSDSRFRRALNRATYGQGVDILDRFVKHTVRGESGDKMDYWSKKVRHVRRNVKMYFIGYKVLTGLRQGISTLNGLAANPKVAGAWYSNMKSVIGDWKAYENIREEVEGKSADVKYRSWDRDIKRHWTGESAKDFLVGRQRFDKRAVWMMRKIDKFTVVMLWKSLHDHARMNENMSEQAAIEYADTWIGRTQPMGDPEHLPDFFRGGEISKALTDFQQMPNQTWNAVMHDIIGARRAKRITNNEAAYRLLMSMILPSMVLGMIGRGRPQKNAAEILTDLMLYPLGVIPVAGRWLEKAIRGWNTSSSLAATPLEEIKKLAGDIQRGNVPGIVKHSATTVGSATGRIPHQAIITGEGIYDLAEGESKDPRRLLWSKYQLGEDDNKPDSSTPRRSSPRSGKSGRINARSGSRPIN